MKRWLLCFSLGGRHAGNDSKLPDFARITKEYAMITKLADNEIFVFGSNLAGVHGAGAARFAAKNFGAKRGVGEGLTGRCYAIPTKDYKIKTRSLPEIKESVANFMAFAKRYPQYRFMVTPIGCGLAGYTPEQIAPMFVEAPANVILPLEFL